MPLWGVEVLYIQTTFGRRSTVSAKVTVGTEEEPKVSPMTPIAFTGLAVEARPNKAGGLVEMWSADALVEGSKQSGTGKPTAGQSSSSSSPSSSAAA